MSTIIQSKKTLLTVALGGAIAIVLAFGSFSTVSAQALTQSQIDSILGLLESFGADEATMNDVEAALTGEDTDDTTPTTPAPDVAQFDRDLSTGSTGDDVKSLQEWLNDNGYTVATEGAGSPGNETDYFGERTREAVAAYQSANGIEPVAGYFGPKTREAVNAEIEDAVEDDDDDATDDDDDDATDDDDDADDDADDDEDVVAREGVLTAEARSDYRNVEVGANQTKNV
ncbi:MAG: peptidoglycan-binding domain-containing protein, partial [Candidatus Paceibacterota bacterium]